MLANEILVFLSLGSAANLWLAGSFSTQHNQTFLHNEVARNRRRRDVFCDVTIRDKEGWIFSPNYPARYGNYKSCDYVIERYSSDVCEVKLTLPDFDIQESPHCYTDYVELQDGPMKQRICGLLASGTKKTLHFPTGIGILTLKFRSSGYNSGKGFSIKVKQIRNSCYAPEERGPSRTPCSQRIDGLSGRITSPGFPYNYGPGQYCTYTIRRHEPRACQVELDFRRFDLEHSKGCEKDYLELPGAGRLCGSLGAVKRVLQFPSGNNEVVLTFSSDDHGGTGRGFDIKVSQLPGPCGRGSYPQPGRQCDQEISSSRGTFTSPGYPGFFGPNHRCLYVIRRPDTSVCKMELDFTYFDVGRHNPKSCYTGAYLELPDRSRLCHVFTGKRLIEVTKFVDPVMLQFFSDSHSSGKGFQVHLTQLPNTCERNDKSDKDYPSLIPDSVRRCYQEVTSYTGHFTPPTHPLGFPGSVMQCQYVIHRAHPSVCIVRLQVSAFRNHGMTCAANFIELPDRSKMCIAVAPPRQLKFEPGVNIINIIYHGRDEVDFNLIVDQQHDSCKRHYGWSWKIIPRR